MVSTLLGLSLESLKSLHWLESLENDVLQMTPVSDPDIARGFSNVPWRKRAFGPGTKHFFFNRIFGDSWGLVHGEGGAPGTVPLHNLRVTSHVLHQEVPLAWYRVRFF